MNDTNIATLYRRMLRSRTPAASLDADTLAALAEGTAKSPASGATEAQLVAMLRELKPASEMLAAQVRRTDRDAHPGRSVTPRRAAHERLVIHARRTHMRVMRWAAVAACLVAVMGLWSWQHSADLRGDAMTAQTVEVQQDRAAADQLSVTSESVASRGDIIFTTRDNIFRSEMDPRVTRGQQSRDEVFSGGFNG